MKRVLFVCLGNICRSPAAEGVLRHLVTRAEPPLDVEIQSAGTIGYHIGKSPDQRMCTAASKRGYNLCSKAQQVTARDLDDFDLVIAMDRDNFRDLHRLSHQYRAEIKMLSDFLDESWPRDVPDPYYGGADGFETVLNMLEAAGPRIIDYLRSDRSKK